MIDMVEELKEYFKNTPREKVLSDWAKSQGDDQVGPTLNDYLESSKKLSEQELDFEFEQAERFFGHGSPNSGHLIRTKKGVIGRTLHTDDLVNGKVKVYTESGNFLCDPNTLKLIGFID